MDDKRYSRREFLKRGVTLTGGSVALGAVGTAAAATPNSIVTENQLTGSPQTEWDLSDTGQYSGFGLTDPNTGQQPTVTNFIEGFADDISVNRGHACFVCQQQSPSSWRNLRTSR